MTTDKQAARQAARQTDRQTDRQTGRQTGRQTYMYLCSLPDHKLSSDVCSCQYFVCSILRVVDCRKPEMWVGLQ